MYYIKVSKPSIIANLITTWPCHSLCQARAVKRIYKEGPGKVMKVNMGVPHPMGVKQWESTTYNAQRIQHHRGPFPQKRTLESHHHKPSLLLNNKYLTSKTVKLLEENRIMKQKGASGVRKQRQKLSKRQSLLWGKGHHKDITYRREIICKPFV